MARPQRPRYKKWHYAKQPLNRGPSVDTHCAIYTRTGRCNNFGKCRYLHERQHRALCQTFLKTGQCAKFGKARCYLNHTPVPQNTPMCVHFARGRCEKQDCIYTHMLNLDKNIQQVPVCRSFALNGWCENGSMCTRKHVFECPDFSLYQKCSNRNCHLAHIIKRVDISKPVSSNNVILLSDFIDFLKNTDRDDFLKSVLPAESVNLPNDADADVDANSDAELEENSDGELVNHSNQDDLHISDHSSDDEYNESEPDALENNVDFIKV